MRLPLLLILCASLLFITNCKPEKEDCFDPTNPQCKNYDPCYGQKPVTADIELSQRIELGAIIGENVVYITDHNNIFPKSQIRFHCPLDNAKYTWILGSETITSQTFERHFFDSPFDTYSVRLIVEKTPNKSCFPADNGIDTMTLKFKIVKVCELASVGVFKGKWDNIQSDSALISFRTFFDGTLTDSCNTGISRYTNLQNKDDTLFGSKTYVSNSEVINYYPGTAGLGNLNLKYQDSNSTVHLDYFIGTKHFVFRGRKYSN